MATKSKSQIIKNIDKNIITNGNIRATDTNTILKDILDCTELNSQGSSEVITFGFNSTTALKDPRGGSLNYSLRGAINSSPDVNHSFVNITFKIEVQETNLNVFTFAHNSSKIFQVLKSIVDTKTAKQMDFLVKIENSKSVSNNLFRVGSLNFEYNTKNFVITINSQDPNDKLFKEDKIFTSFTIHAPQKF